MPRWGLPPGGGSVLVSAHLAPLKKTEDTSPEAPIEVRPVAVGEVLRRVVSEVLMTLPCMRVVVADMEPTMWPPYVVCL